MLICSTVCIACLAKKAFEDSSGQCKSYTKILIWTRASDEANKTNVYSRWANTFFWFLEKKCWVQWNWSHHWSRIVTAMPLIKHEANTSTLNSIVYRFLSGIFLQFSGHYTLNWTGQLDHVKMTENLNKCLPRYHGYKSMIIFISVSLFLFGLYHL